MKHFYRFLTSIIISLIVILLALYLNRAWFVSLIFSSKLKTKVSIEKINIKKNLISVEGIKIYNKFGNKKEMPYAMTIEALQIKAPLKNYINRHVEIKSILVYHVNIYIQFILKDKSKTNWTALMNSFNPQHDSITDKNSETYSTIKLLEVKRIVAHIGSIFDQDIMRKPIPDMVFKNINTQKGRIFKKIAQTIVGHLVFHVQDILSLPFKIPFEIIKDLFAPKIKKSPVEE